MITGSVRVYLSGPIEYSADHGANWREKAETELAKHGIQCFNPLRSSLAILRACGVSSIEEYSKLKHGTEDERRKFKAITNRLIDIDLQEIRTSHIVLAKISETFSGGTAGELTVSRFLNIPTVAFCDDDITKVSGWVQACPDCLFLGEDAADCAIQYVIETVDEIVMPPSFFSLAESFRDLQ